MQRDDWADFFRDYPCDVAGRQVFADWLDERGEATWAERIRLETELFAPFWGRRGLFRYVAGQPDDGDPPSPSSPAERICTDELATGDAAAPSEFVQHSPHSQPPAQLQQGARWQQLARRRLELPPVPWCASTFEIVGGLPLAIHRTTFELLASVQAAALPVGYWSLVPDTMPLLDVIPKSWLRVVSFIGSEDALSRRVLRRLATFPRLASVHIYMQPINDAALEFAARLLDCGVERVRLWTIPTEGQLKPRFDHIDVERRRGEYVFERLPNGERTVVAGAASGAAAHLGLCSEIVYLPSLLAEPDDAQIASQLGPPSDR